MELNITHLFSDDSSFVPFDLSNNRATLGDNAGALTWAASVETAAEIVLLDTPEKREAFKDFVADAGAWDSAEINAWSETELNALCLQWIAGDVREAFGDADFADWDWAEYEVRAERGSISSRLFKNGSDVYFYIGS
jgi:hypothetical protein